MPGDTDESRQRWRSVAAGWARRRALFAEVAAPVTSSLVSLLRPEQGETVLELACGPGSVGFSVAEIVGAEGSVLVTDFAPEMVHAARGQARELGLANVTFAVVDGQRTGLPGGAFDGVVCRFGYMLMPEPVRGLAETARVLRPRGRVAFAVWGDRRRNSWATAAGRALVELGHAEPPDPFAPGPFALDDPDRLAAVVAAAGLDLVAVEDVDVFWRYASVDEWWSVSTDLSSTLREGLTGLPRRDVEAVRARAAGLLEPDAGGPGLVIRGVARTVLAVPSPGVGAP